jgi:hypothetical protein
VFQTQWHEAFLKSHQHYEGRGFEPRRSPSHTGWYASDKRVLQKERLGTLEFVWNNQIVPLLEEYFYTQREKLAQLLAPFLADLEAGSEGDSSDDAAFELGRNTGDSLIFALHELVSRVDTQS